MWIENDVGSCSSQKEDPGSERVRHAGRHVDRVADGDVVAVHRREHRLAVLPRHPVAQRLERDVVAEPEPRRGARLGVDDHPALGLAVRRAEVLSRERARGMEVDRQPLAGVEQLDQHARRSAGRRRERRAQPALRVLGDRVAQQPSVGQA